jgi:tetraacyldisaccharide 4'-kinase
VTEKILSYLKYLLYPFSLLYGLIIWIRNLCYDWEIISAVSFDIPTIAVGNLSVGGTGKTPHVEYLIRLLKEDFRVATLSRGYHRKTRDYQFAGQGADALQIGDEPMQFHLKFPEIAVAVGEDRVLALPQLLMDAPETEVVLLDDGFQHRSILPGLNILVTEFHRRFTKDHIVPFGRLRESRSGYRRADVIIVSKCPDSLSISEKGKIAVEIHPMPDQSLFFTTMDYENPVRIDGEHAVALSKADQVLLVTGIADPGPLRKLLAAAASQVIHMKFPDHYYYRAADLKEITNQFRKMPGDRKLIITTEKDAARLTLLHAEFPQDFPCYVMAMKPRFLFGDEISFRQRIFGFISEEKQRIESENG